MQYRTQPESELTIDGAKSSILEGRTKSTCSKIAHPSAARTRVSNFAAASVLACLSLSISTFASADIVGVGTFYNEVTPNPVFPFIPLPMEGSLTWNNESHTFLGSHTVNMGTLLGTSPTTGSIDNVFGFIDDVIFVSAISMSFSSSPVLSMGSSLGTATCENGTACNGTFDSKFALPIDSMSGTLVGTGSGQLPMLSSTITYSLLSDSICVTSPSPATCNGTFALNVFEAFPTSAGTSVAVSDSTTFYNPIIDEVVNVEFDIVFDDVTSGGDTIIQGVSISEVVVPANFATDVSGFRALFFEIQTTADFTDDVLICASAGDGDNDGLIDDTPFDECGLRLLHSEAGIFADRTLVLGDADCPVAPQDNSCGFDTDLQGIPCIDTTTGNQICGSVTSFSTFALALVPQLGVTPVPSLNPTSVLILSIVILVAMRTMTMRQKRDMAS